nr:8364_t:CDS:1 [Entrophospora candida]
MAMENDIYLNIPQRTFINEKYLLEAITHKTYAQENLLTAGPYNERLELLGDSVISFLVIDYLYEKFPDYNEGKLTAIKSKLVCKKSLAKFGFSIGLPNLLRLGIGALAEGSRYKEKFIEDAFEAYIGAVFLDCGKNYKEVAEYLRQFLEPAIKEIASKENTEQEEINEITQKLNGIGPIDSSISNKDYLDSINKLQTWSQRRGLGIPVYKPVDELGVSYPVCNPMFAYEVMLNDEIIGKGSGSNKKEAKKKAAIDALRSHLNFNIDDNITEPINTLQIYYQRRGGKIPEYKEVHSVAFKSNPEFTFQVFINNDVYGVGTGSNTKNARKAAANNALEKIYRNESICSNPFINNNEHEPNSNTPVKFRSKSDIPLQVADSNNNALEKFTPMCSNSEFKKIQMVFKDEAVSDPNARKAIMYS